MHTTVPENSRLHSERSSQDAALSSGAENHSSIASRRTGKASRRKPSVTDATLAPRQPRKARRERAARGWVDETRDFLVHNQIRMSLALISLLAATYALFPHLRPEVRKFYDIQYYNPQTGLYAKGPDDLYLVFFWIVLFTFLRSSILDYVLVPLARCGGINTRKGVVRFSEQAWLVIYYGVFWGVGMHLLRNSPYWFNMQQLWTDWPLRETTGLLKWYYLAQFAFWLQQIFVLNIEERRKDHYQMFAHHIITCALIASSYCYHMTRVGHVILCIMDVIDIMLSVAKLLKYLGFTTVCDYAFGIFLVSWIVGRHGMYNWIVYSVWKDSVTTIVPGCYAANGILIPARNVDIRTLWRTFTFQSETVCFTLSIQRTFMALLVGLQFITLIWLFMILRVAYRVVRGAGADDTRSEDEEDEEDDELDELEEISKQTAGAEAIVRMVGTSRAAATNGHARSHLPSQPLGDER